jgi:hypothetical protein
VPQARKTVANVEERYKKKVQKFARVRLSNVKTVTNGEKGLRNPKRMEAFRSLPMVVSRGNKGKY